MAKKTGNNPRSIPEGKTQINGNIPTPVFNKLKAIAALHTYSQTEVYILAFEKFIELYEKKNGPIKAGPAKKDIKL